MSNKGRKEKKELKYAMKKHDIMAISRVNTISYSDVRIIREKHIKQKENNLKNIGLFVVDGNGINLVERKNVESAINAVSVHPFMNTMSIICSSIHTYLSLIRE